MNNVFAITWCIGMLDHQGAVHFQTLQILTGEKLGVNEKNSRKSEVHKFIKKNCIGG